jgi:hypothetical protein
MTPDRFRIVAAVLFQSLNIPLAVLGVIRASQERWTEGVFLLCASGLLWGTGVLAVRRPDRRRPRWNVHG